MTGDGPDAPVTAPVPRWEAARRRCAVTAAGPRGGGRRAGGRHRSRPGTPSPAPAPVERRSGRRRPSVRVVAVAAAAVLLVGALVAVLVSGRTTGRPADGPRVPEPPPPAAPAPVACTDSAGSPDRVAELVAGAAPGDTVCVTGDVPATADLVLRGEGAAGRPILVVGQGATVRSVTVTGSSVTVQGFTTQDGEGVVLAGTGLAARGNVVRDATHDGISCADPCTDAEIVDNTVVRADGTGIAVEGQRITVRANRISDSRKIEATDADGIRFFGSELTLADNRITDITDAGYARDAPHTDCFQTFDNGSPPTVDVTITGNECRDVDHQCLIATAEESGQQDRVGRSRGIEFRGNTCAVNGSQAVLVRWFPDVHVVGNVLGGPQLEHAAVFSDGSTGAEFRDNRLAAGVPPYEIDDASRPGFVTDTPG